MSPYGLCRIPGLGFKGSLQHLWSEEVLVVPRYRLLVEKEAEFWDRLREGTVPDAIPALIGVSTGSCFRWLADRGGVKPPVGYGRSKRFLTFAEREEIALCNAEGLGVRAIAKLLRRSPSTSSRELRRAPRHPHNVRPKV
ncbi:helix-turn-helix domain-containing protein [Auritidibacter ignavus]|uniref:helix-turn-helix domain-containing protein n=1 Tax=Auritidibacter ignavus TaxID=678932 RepID=UPI003CC5F5FF